jgi:hypothetical protein
MRKKKMIYTSHSSNLNPLDFYLLDPLKTVEAVIQNGDTSAPVAAGGGGEHFLFLSHDS